MTPGILMVGGFSDTDGTECQPLALPYWWRLLPAISWYLCYSTFASLWLVVIWATSKWEGHCDGAECRVHSQIHPYNGWKSFPKQLGKIAHRELSEKLLELWLEMFSPKSIGQLFDWIDSSLSWPQCLFLCKLLHATPSQCCPCHPRFPCRIAAFLFKVGQHLCKFWCLMVLMEPEIGISGKL